MNAGYVFYSSESFACTPILHLLLSFCLKGRVRKWNWDIPLFLLVTQDLRSESLEEVSTLVTLLLALVSEQTWFRVMYHYLHSHTFTTEVSFLRQIISFPVFSDFTVFSNFGMCHSFKKEKKERKSTVNKGKNLCILHLDDSWQYSFFLSLPEVNISHTEVLFKCLFYYCCCSFGLKKMLAIKLL